MSYTPFVDPFPLSASEFNQRLTELQNQIDGTNALDILQLTAGTELTISSGAVTVTQSVHTIDTESDAASDDLTDINGGSIGDVLIISAQNTARTVVVKHNTSKIALADGADVSLDETWKSVMLYKIGASLWVEVKSPSPAGGGSTPSYVKVSDTKAKGTTGGVSAAAAYQIRTLNTEDSDPDGICTLSSNQVTLDAGTYECRITVPGGFCTGHHAVLWNATDSSLVLNGTSEYSTDAGAAVTRCMIVGRFVIAASKALEVRHYTAASITSGLGVANNINDPGGASLSEVYTVAEFWKVA